MPDRLAEALRLAEAIRMSVSNIKPARNEADRCLRDSAMRVNATEIARLLREEIASRSSLADSAKREPSDRERVAVEALRGIANSPHQSYDSADQPCAVGDNRQYAIGVADGHRCAGDIARRAMATLAEMEQADG